MKFKVVHEDYWPEPEVIKDDIEIHEARVLVRRLEAKYPDNEYFICESSDKKYNPIPRVNWFDKYYRRWNL